MTSKRNRTALYMDDETNNMLTDTIAYLVKEGRITEDRNISQALTYTIKIFHQLFVKNDTDEDYAERLARLNGKNTTLIEDIQKENRQVKRQLDQLLYLSLANFHVSENPDWDVQELESVSSDYSVEQKQLLERVEQLIKEDVARGQTMKYSHKP
ncbi:TPA: hypothetical protein ACWZZZ_001131 [Streptococcus agalactiae]